VQGNEVERVTIGLGEGAAALKVAVEGFEMTPNGLLELGKGELDTEAGKSPGAAVGLVTFAATKNPLGLIVSTGVKLHEEKTGSATIQGKVKQVATQIAAELRRASSSRAGSCLRRTEPDALRVKSCDRLISWLVSERGGL